MATELETQEALQAHLHSGRSLDSVVLQGLSLLEHETALLQLSMKGAVFLGCSLSPALRAHIESSGGVIFPLPTNLPFHPYRGQLYTVDELLEGFDRGNRESFFTKSRDAKIYRYTRSFEQSAEKLPILDSLYQRLHDHAIEDAMMDLLKQTGSDGVAPRKVVAVMGGHGEARGSAVYCAAARMARKLHLRGYFLATGGGPGVMEATHLGAYMASYEPSELEKAIAVLAKAPDYKHPDWFETAQQVRDQWRSEALSLAVPTWFYGHEPTNFFASHVAKFFANALREDGLLAIAKHGVIYARGSAGTVQELFLDACQNHYGTIKVLSPMVLFGSEYWTKDKPAMPLLQALAKGRPYAQLLHCTDDEDSAVEFVAQHPPVPA